MTNKEAPWYEKIVGTYGYTVPGDNARIIVETEVCRECESTADLTIDFDVLGDLSQIAICTDCVPTAIEKIVSDLEKNGVLSARDTIGFNGNGRT